MSSVLQFPSLDRVPEVTIGDRSTDVKVLLL